MTASEDELETTKVVSAEVSPYPDVSQEHHLSSVPAMYDRMPYCIVNRNSFDFRQYKDNGNQEEAICVKKAPLLSKSILSLLVNIQLQSQLPPSKCFHEW